MKPIVKYEDHQHPLTVVEIDNSGLFNECQACGYDIDGIHLRCVQCRILFHVHCGSQKPNLPQAIVNKHHHEHPLTLTTTETSTIDESNYPLCAACSKKRKPWHPFYSCAECEDYSVHVRCVVTEKQFERDKLKHASHRHYLIFNEKEVGDDDVVIICHICETSLQGPAYSCGTCEFSIHKSCAELPVKIDHPFHRHPLTLSKTNHSSNRCRACLDESSRVAYKCHECCYNLHYRCTSLKPSINFKGHDEHALIYFEKLPSKPKCEAWCGITNPDASYLHCAICNFTIHFACGSLPKNIKHWSHQHPLNLMNNFFYYNYDDQMCDICEMKRYADECVYYCAECYFVAELKCVLHEVMQSLQEKEPYDVELRTIKERNPEDLTFHDVFSSFTKKDRNQLDDITENMESEIAGITKTLSETGDQGSKVTISESYPYSDEALALFILRLENGIPRKIETVEFWDMDDVLVNVEVWGSYRVIEKFAPMLKDLLTKYSDIDGDCSLNENCSMYFFAMLCGVMQDLCRTKIMNAKDFERERLYELETKKDKLSKKIDQLKKEIEQLTANIEELNLESREIKSSAQGMYEQNVLHLASSDSSRKVTLDKM
ncbi:phorbol-ester/DAG-type domain-containing protein [Citrus sinensis]|uniref:Phorbol-ester/DAG-type domain-containing protein n=1 Tax=Citrus sinensis TaxID=2711 RepID=A0ACB8KIC0_CITSI|nr:phorbol-ester/DAG-type domain-containing protein [Citrus sinensis]